MTAAVGNEAAAQGEDAARTHSVRRGLIVCCAVAALLRLVGLDAFPGVVADEGLWTNSSKNFFLFGDWFMDGRTHALLSPVYHGLSLLSYALFGASMESARVVSALASTASIPLLYGLVWRSTGRVPLALSTAIVFGLSSTYAYAGRQALIEATQIFFALLAAFFAARRDMRGAVLGGVAFGLALLTKLNVLFLAPALALFLLPTERPFEALRGPRVWVLGVALGATTLAVAGGTNLALYLAVPEQFNAAYLFELEGNQFVAATNPIVRVGRFGIDPVTSARSIVELVRESPIQMVLCALGVIAGAVGRRSLPIGFWVWLGWGTAFVLIQLYQPMRYFLLAAPAYAFFAAVALHAWGESEGDERVFVWTRMQAGALALYVAFNVSYLAMNAVANRDERLDTVRRWVAEHTDPDDRIVAAAWFCTDLPNRAYAHYHLGSSDIDALAPNLERYAIDYVIYDDREWSAASRDALLARYPLVADWPFGAVFRVTAPSPDGVRGG